MLAVRIAMLEFLRESRYAAPSRSILPGPNQRAAVLLTGCGERWR